MIQVQHPNKPAQLHRFVCAAGGVLLLAWLPKVTAAQSPTATPPSSAAQPMNPQALDLLRQTEAVYRGMTSFACTAEHHVEGNGRRGKWSKQYTLAVQYQRPTRLTLTLLHPTQKWQWTQGRTNGQSVYLVQGGLGECQWAEVPPTGDPFDLRYNLEYQLRVPIMEGMAGLAALFSPTGLLASPEFRRFQNLTVSRPFVYRGVTVQTITASSAAPLASFHLRLTIGTGDHLLYRTEATNHTKDFFHHVIVEYLHSKNNPVFEEATFGPPRKMKFASQMTVTNVGVECIYLSKGSHPVRIGDDLAVYNPSGYFWLRLGRVRVTRVEGNEIVAENISMDSARLGLIAVPSPPYGR